MALDSGIPWEVATTMNNDEMDILAIALRIKNGEKFDFRTMQFEDLD